MADEVALACDEMLGRLATWLRLLGYDTAYLRRSDEAGAVERAHVDGRVLVTRASALAARYPPSILVRADDVRGQLAEVLASLGQQPRRERLFTRCARCNLPLEAADRDAVREHVPAHPRRTFSEFRRCPGCRRVYWPGGHHDRFLSAVEGIVVRAGSPNVQSRA